MIQKPKGCNDIYGREAKIWKYVESVIDATMEKYNYNYIRTPIFESTELFHRGIGESTDIVTKETYDFVDRGGRNMTLRPEGTAGVCRSYVENKMYGDPNQPVKVYYNGTMYRYERPQSGRDRELTQFGMEVLGSDDPMTDAEVISLAVNIYKMLGLKEIKVNINSLGDKESRDIYRKALIDYLNEESRERFEKVKDYLDILQIKYEVNPNIVRGLDYYNHTVFEIEAKVKGFGSNNVLGGGGRYNHLCSEIGGPETPCIGFASGIGRLVMALELEEVKLPIVEDVDLFLMYVNDEEKKYALYLAQELRMAGFIVETEYTGRSLKGQFKQADRLQAKYLAILNSEDLDNNEVKIRDNKTKEEEIISLDALIYYLDEKLNTGFSEVTEEEMYSWEEHEEDCDCDGDCGEDCHCGHHHHHE